jgi:hypothetical protein
MFYRWRRMEEEDRGRVWRLYGWYSGLMACGSCFGAVTWAALMMHLVNLFEAHHEPSHSALQLSLYGQSFSWLSAFRVLYSIESLCICAANLVVLDRMSVFAAPQGTRLLKRWALAGRVVMAVVVLGNCVGLAANAAAAVHYQKVVDVYNTASTGPTLNYSSYSSYGLQVAQERYRAASIASLQSFSEVAVLLFIVIAFVVAGVMSARRVTSRLHAVKAASEEAATARALRLQVLGTTASVFVSFLVRCAWAALYAITNQWRDIDSDGRCYARTMMCDATCRNVFALISVWLTYTPEFQLIIILMASPVAQLVVLWGMTSKSTLQLMKSSKRGGAMTLRLVNPSKQEKL